MRKKICLIITLMLIMVVTFGCGKIEELQNNITSSLADIINEGEVEEDECPEGYVYDYQVSMEPIPEEIAALGGEVCGTIHAYPTRIKIALAKQEIENNPELQEQNEKNIQGVQQYLAETYGGEFEIEPLKTGIWCYMCTEISTNKSFMVYINSLYTMGVSDDVVDIDTYFCEYNAQNYNNDINLVLSENLKTDFCYKTQKSDDVLYIEMAVLLENNFSYTEEQKMIVELYDRMKELLKDNGEKSCLGFTITYFPQEYQEIMLKQYQSDNIYDVWYISDECADKLLKEQEIVEQFEYHEFYIDDENNELKQMSEDKGKYFENEYILPYWRGRE